MTKVILHDLTPSNIFAITFRKIVRNDCPNRTLKLASHDIYATVAIILLEK